MINRDKGRQPFLAPAWTSREKRLPPNVEEWLVQPTETFVPLRADLEARGSVFAICLSSPSASTKGSGNIAAACEREEAAVWGTQSDANETVSCSEC